MYDIGLIDVSVNVVFMLECFCCAIILRVTLNLSDPVGSRSHLSTLSKRKNLTLFTVATN